jgi:hypothetical protein
MVQSASTTTYSSVSLVELPVSGEDTVQDFLQLILCLIPNSDITDEFVGVSSRQPDLVCKAESAVNGLQEIEDAGDFVLDLTKRQQTL